MDLSKLTIASARKALDAKEFSSRELTDAYLSEIAKKDKDILHIVTGKQIGRAHV